MNALFNTGSLRKSLRLVSITICLLFGLSLLIACSSEPTATPAPPPTPTSSLPFPTQGSYNDFPAPINPKIAALSPFEMKVWFADDYYNQAPITDLITEFQKAYPNIKIKLDHAEWDAMKDKVKQAVKSGNPPDVVHQHSFVLAAQGYAEPLDDLWRQWGGNRIGQFFPGAVEEVSWQASLYGMPLDINAMFLMYNKTMFKDAGLPEPNANYTYTKLLEDAKKLTKADGSVYGIGIHNAPWNTYGLMRSVEGKLLDQVPGQPVSVQLASDQNIQLLGMLSDMVNKYKVSPMPALTGRYDLVDLFNQRKIAMFFTGPWDLTRVQQEGPPGLYNEVGTAPMPRGFDGKAKPGSVQGGGSLFVAKGSKNKEAAFEFMKWAVSPKYQLRLALEMGRYPVLKELYRNQFFTSQPLLQPFLDMLNYSHPYELEAYADGDQVFTQALQAIINKGQDARTVLQASNQQIEKVVKP